jgi:hypothetical protein
LSAAINPFYSVHVDLLWAALVNEFGRDVDYWPGGDDTQAVTLTVIWKEGVEDEEVTPGRYSHLQVRNDSLPAAPLPGDAVSKDGFVYDVVRVDAYAYYYSRLVIQERG